MRSSCLVVHRFGFICSFQYNCARNRGHAAHREGISAAAFARRQLDLHMGWYFDWRSLADHQLKAFSIWQLCNFDSPLHSWRIWFPACRLLRWWIASSLQLYAFQWCSCMQLQIQFWAFLYLHLFSSARGSGHLAAPSREQMLPGHFDQMHQPSRWMLGSATNWQHS